MKSNNYLLSPEEIFKVFNWEIIKNNNTFLCDLYKYRTMQCKIFRNTTSKKSEYIIPAYFKKEYVMDLKICDSFGNKLYIVPINESLPAIKNFLKKYLEKWSKKLKNEKIKYILENKKEDIIDIIDYACSFECIGNKEEITKKLDFIEELLDNIIFFSNEKDKVCINIYKLFLILSFALKYYIPLVKVPNTKNNIIELIIEHDTKSISISQFEKIKYMILGKAVVELDCLPIHPSSNTFIFESTEGLIIKDFKITDIIENTCIDKLMSDEKEKNKMIDDNKVTIYISNKDSKLLIDEHNILEISLGMSNSFFNNNIVSLLTKFTWLFTLLALFLPITEKGELLSLVFIPVALLIPNAIYIGENKGTAYRYYMAFHSFMILSLLTIRLILSFTGHNLLCYEILNKIINHIF